MARLNGALTPQRGVPTSLTTTATVAALACGRSRGVILPFRLPRMTELSAIARKRFCLAQRNLSARFDKLERILVGRLAVKLKRFVAHGVTQPSLETVPVIIQHFFERAFVNDRLVAFEAGALFALECFDGH